MAANFYYDTSPGYIHIPPLEFYEDPLPYLKEFCRKTRRGIYPEGYLEIASELFEDLLISGKVLEDIGFAMSPSAKKSCNPPVFARTFASHLKRELKIKAIETIIGCSITKGENANYSKYIKYIFTVPPLSGSIKVLPETTAEQMDYEVTEIATTTGHIRKSVVAKPKKEEVRERNIFREVIEIITMCTPHIDYEKITNEVSKIIDNV